MYRLLKEDELKKVFETIDKKIKELPDDYISLRITDGTLIGFIVKAVSGEYCLLDGFTVKTVTYSNDIDDIKEFIATTKFKH